MPDANINKDVSILIVDDDADVRSFLERYLTKKGFEKVKSVGSGLEAIKAVEDDDVDIVLLDIKMPNVDGIDVLRRIKQIDGKIGVIMITGYPGEDEAKEALEMGAFDLIMKPFDLAYLETCLYSKIILMMGTSSNNSG